MVEITDCREPCFAELKGGCAVLTSACNSTHCPFYKPAGCKDWIRLERGRKVYILAPEEYYEEM